MSKGIDVAKWQGVIDWGKVKAAGVQFAVIKVINKSGNKESAFERNYAGAVANGIPVDVYNYSYATSVQQATQDASKVLAVIKGKKVDYVWMDVEDKVQQVLGMTLVDMINAYQSIIERAGYKFGVYTGLSFYNTLLRPYASSLKCIFWIARYPSGAVMDLSMEPMEGKKPNIIHQLWGWQYSSKGRIDGINGNVDLNVKYDSLVQPTWPTIRIGSRGQYVTILQQKLAFLGYKVGKIDGIFGNKTEAAVRAYQEVEELKVDGIVGAKTWKSFCI